MLWPVATSTRPLSAPLTTLKRIARSSKGPSAPYSAVEDDREVGGVHFADEVGLFVDQQPRRKETSAKFISGESSLTEQEAEDPLDEIAVDIRNPDTNDEVEIIFGSSPAGWSIGLFWVTVNAPVVYVDR